MWSTGPLVQCQEVTEWLCSQCPSWKSSPWNMHLLEKKQSLVTPWSSQMTISYLYCPLLLCTFGQLFPLFLFPQPGISCTIPHYAGSTQQQKVCDCTCHSLGIVKVRHRALKVTTHIAWKERRKQVLDSVPLSEGGTRSAWCLIRQPWFHVYLEAYLARRQSRHLTEWQPQIWKGRTRAFPVWM